MTPYLYRSFGGDIDYGCLSEKGDWATALVDGAGVVANLALMVFGCALAFLFYRTVAHPLFAVFASAFAAANYIEAFSYLIVNTIYLRSDMIAVAEVLPVNIYYLTSFSTVIAVLTFKPTFHRLISWLNERYRENGATSVLIVGATICAVMAAGRSDLTNGASPQDSSVSVTRAVKSGLDLDESEGGPTNTGRSVVLNSSRLFRIGNFALDIKRLRTCRV